MIAVIAFTRLFKSGNSQAVRISAELDYEGLGVELQISRMGDVITMFPARRSLKDGISIPRDLPKPSEPELREPIDVPERDRN